MNNEQVTEIKTDENSQQTKETEVSGKKKGKWKAVLVLVLTLILLSGAVVGFHFVRQGGRYISTDNARITTDLITVSSAMPGTLERFMIYEGRRVRQDEILGWIENGEAMRSPIDGLVIHTSAVQGQEVLPMAPLAVVADTGGLHIQANIEESDILRIQPGQSVYATIDAFGSRQFAGYVSRVGHITQAELTGSTLFFNTGGTFTRVTHLIPVEIVILDDVDLSSLIGTNARVRIRVG